VFLTNFHVRNSKKISNLTLEKLEYTLILYYINISYLIMLYKYIKFIVWCMFVTLCYCIT